MRNENVGSLPVISDQQSRKLVGMVTDRDLALGVLADNHTPSTPVHQVMSREISSCSPEDDYHRALENMEKNQVRRIPVVDSSDCVVGIVAQADIATRVSNSEEVAEVVGEISQAGAEAGRSSRPGTTGRAREMAWEGMRDCLLMTSGIGLGAALMFFLDPGRGQRRRSLARDQAVSMTKKGGRALQRKQKDLSNRASGVLAKAAALYSSEPGDVDTLTERVRSKIGHIVSNARSVEVHTSGGTVELKGTLPASELDRLISAVRDVRGVTNVVNRIDATYEGRRVPEGTQAGSDAAGGINLLGFRSKSSMGKTVAGMATGLLSRTLAGRPRASVNKQS